MPVSRVCAALPTSPLQPLIATMIASAGRTTEKLFFGLKSETFSLSLRLPLTSLTKTLGEVSGYFPRGISTFPQLAIFYFLRRSKFRGQCITI